MRNFHYSSASSRLAEIMAKQKCALTGQPRAVTTAELATLLGVKKHTVSMAKGRHPNSISIEKWEILSLFFNVSLCYLRGCDCPPRALSRTKAREMRERLAGLRAAPLRRKNGYPPPFLFAPHGAFSVAKRAMKIFSPKEKNMPYSNDMPAEPLDFAAATLPQLEAVIHEHQYGFAQVAKALREIRVRIMAGDEARYTDYLARHFPTLRTIGRTYQHYLQSAGETIAVIEAANTSRAVPLPLPANEAQARALSAAPLEQRPAIMERALEIAGEKPITAPLVAQVISETKLQSEKLFTVVNTFIEPDNHSKETPIQAELLPPEPGFVPSPDRTRRSPFTKGNEKGYDREPTTMLSLGADYKPDTIATRQARAFHFVRTDLPACFDGKKFSCVVSRPATNGQPAGKFSLDISARVLIDALNDYSERGGNLADLGLRINAATQKTLDADPYDD